MTHLVRRGKAARLVAGIPIDMLDNRKGHRKHSAGRYELKVTETLTSSDGSDMVTVLTKPYQPEEALRQIIPQIGQADYLLLTQDWHGTTAIDAILPQSRYLYGDAEAGGTSKGHTLISAMFPSIDLGQVDGKQASNLKKAATLFESVGATPTLHQDILHYIWIQHAIHAGQWPAVVRAGGLDALLRDPRTRDMSKADVLGPSV